MLPDHLPHLLVPFWHSEIRHYQTLPSQWKHLGDYYLQSLEFWASTLGVTVIGVLGLSGTLIIVVTRQSLCSELNLAILERGALATHPNQTKPSTQFPDI